MNETSSDTALVTLICSGITAISTLGAVLLTNLFNHFQQKRHFEQDVHQKRKDYRKQRAEELYVLIDEWLNKFTHQFLTLVLVMKGDIDYNQHLDQTIQEGKENRFKFNRMDMIIEMYFPELVSDFEDIESKRDVISDIVVCHKKQYKIGNLEGGRYIKSFQKAQNDIIEAGEALMKKVAEIGKRL